MGVGLLAMVLFIWLIIHLIQLVFLTGCTMLMPRTTRTVGTGAAFGGLDGIATCKSQGRRSSETLRQCGAWYREFVTREARMEADKTSRYFHR
jgi:hypothetical protein